jgi:hypothetical protein
MGTSSPRRNNKHEEVNSFSPCGSRPHGRFRVFAQDKVELSGAYQFTTVYANGTTTNSNPGWNASATYYLGTAVSVSPPTGLAPTSTLAPRRSPSTLARVGLQYQFNRKGILRPYVNVLVGDTKYTTSGPANALSTQVGGGVDLSISKHFAVRGGLDYFHAASTANSNLAVTAANGVRPIGGIVFRF